MSGTTVELQNDGAGTVGVDTDGNGTIDHTTFTNFENIRTVSGQYVAMPANDGQGNDTLLDVSALSVLPRAQAVFTINPTTP